MQKKLILTSLVSAVALCGCSIFKQLTIHGDELAHGLTVLEQHMSDLTHTTSILSCSPSTGSPTLLIIPIWFTDSDLYITNNEKKASVRADIEKAYFGDDDDTGWKSVKTYYQELSYDPISEKSLCNIQGTVTDWYEVGYASTNYAPKGYETKTAALAVEASNRYFQTHPEDNRNRYDNDGDGFLDGVMLIYGCPDYRTLDKKSYTNLWAYCYWTQQAKNVSKPVANAYFWASYDFMYSGGYTALEHTGSRYGGGHTENCLIDTHTYIHEMGHVFGLEDYYDYADSYFDPSVNAYRGYNPAGGFSMQDYNIGSHDPFSTMALGWANPYIINEDDLGKDIVLDDFQTSKQVILLTPSFNSHKSVFDECILLELYAPTGLNAADAKKQYGNYPRGPLTTGIRIWHVDARVTSRNNPGTIYNYIPTSGVYRFAMSNTYNNKDYGSPLGSSYYNFNLLQLIRNNVNTTYQPTTVLSSNDLFVKGDTFSLSKYSKQFVNGTKLNNGQSLDYTVTIKNVSSFTHQAVITVNSIK